jgi:hypothetical protein
MCGGAAGALAPARARAQQRWQSAGESRTHVRVGVRTGNGSWAVCYGLGRVNNAFSELNQIFSNELELIRSKDGLPLLEIFEIKYGCAGN